MTGDVEVDLRCGDTDLAPLRPAGTPQSVREEWLPERPSRRVHLRFAARMADCAAAFSAAAAGLGADCGRWAPGAPHLRAEGRTPRWVAVLADVSAGPEPLVEVSFDLPVEQEEARAGAERAAAGHPGLAAFAPLWSACGLRLTMTSVVRTAGGGARGFVHLCFSEGQREVAVRWAETAGFRKTQDDEWERAGTPRLTLLLGPGTVWATAE